MSSPITIVVTTVLYVAPVVQMIVRMHSLQKCQQRQNFLGLSTSKQDLSVHKTDNLKNALKVFRKEKISEHMNKLEQLVSCPNVLLELGDFFIAQVLENFHKIFDVKDVFRYVEVWRKEHAIAILNIISQCFGDVELVAELDIDLMEDVEVDMDWEGLRDDSSLMDMAHSLNEYSFLTESDETFTATTSLNRSSFLGSIANNV